MHVVFEGATYDTSGGPADARQGRASTGPGWRRAGYKQACHIETEDELAKQWPSLLKAEGPVFVRISVNSMWAPRRVPGMPINTWQEHAGEHRRALRRHGGRLTRV